MNATEQFCALVDCDPADVKDVPADRIRAASTHVPTDRAARARGEITMPFGKHKGKQLAEIPREYLEWLIRQPPLDGAKSSTRRGVEKVKRLVSSFLKASR